MDREVGQCVVDGEGKLTLPGAELEEDCSVVAGGPESAGARGRDELLEVDVVLSLVGDKTLGEACLPVVPGSGGGGEASIIKTSGLALGRRRAAMTCTQCRWGNARGGGGGGDGHGALHDGSGEGRKVGDA